MSGENVGRLNVYIIDQDRKVALSWRLTGSQGEDWELGQFRIDAAQGFKVSNLCRKEWSFYLKTEKKIFMFLLFRSNLKV